MKMTNMRGKRQPFSNREPYFNIDIPFDDIEILKCNNCKYCLFEDLCKEYGNSDKKEGE